MARPKNTSFNQPNQLIGTGNPVNIYWTNFDRKNPTEYNILYAKPESEDYWEFRTNISQEDFDLFWDEKRIRRFLYQMYDTYATGRVSV